MRANVRGVMFGEPGRLFVERGFCRGCGKQVAGRRVHWCSDECVHQYRIRNDQGYARDALVSTPLATPKGSAETTSSTRSMTQATRGWAACTIQRAGTERS